jgi:quercetin dioxygenase-like cupin family protein
MPSDTPPDVLMLELLASSLDPITPPPEARSRLFEAVEGAGRFLPFYADLSHYFDLTRDRVKEILSQLDDPASWTRGIEPIQGYLHFRPGPRLVALRGGLIRMNPGAHFARHRHVDREVTYVLEGALRDDSGVRFGPGEAIAMGAGTEHSLQVDGDTPALIALLNGAVDMLG